jgi:hypothetical protein
MAALALRLAKRLAPCLASAERLWQTLTSRQAARTPTAPAESVDRAAQLCEPLLVAAAEECIPVHGRGRWTLPLRWTRKQREAAQKQNKLRVQRTVEAVLLSSDLVPHILAPLQLEDGAVAAVCSQWEDSWEELWLGGKLPIDLRFWALFDNFGTDADSDTEEEPEEDCRVRMEYPSCFDQWTRGSKATLWLKSGVPRYVPSKRIKQLGSLAEAVQAQEQAADTGTCVFYMHPTDRLSKEDLEEFASDPVAFKVKYHHHVPHDAYVRDSYGSWRRGTAYARARFFFL